MLNPLMSFEQMCTQDSLTFEEVVKVVKHLVFWGFGRVIYPIKPTSVYRITEKIAIVEQTVSEKYKAKFPKEDMTKTISTMFSKGPTSLAEVSLHAKRPMQELYRKVIFFLKHELLNDMKTHVCIRLQSASDNIDLLQRNVLSKQFPS